MFSQDKSLTPSLWNFCDQMLPIYFVLAHVPSVENLAPDYLSRLEIPLDGRIHLKLTNLIPVFQVETDVASKTPTQEKDETDY